MSREGKWWLPDPAIWEGTWRDDWRIMGQEGYLRKKRLQHRYFNRSLCVEDFDQCEFCWDCFDDDPAHPMMAYFEPINKHWICEECYNDFKSHFDWTVKEIQRPIPGKGENEESETTT